MLLSSHHSARQQLACCKFPLGTDNLSWFWKQCARRGLHSCRDSVLFPFFPFSEIDVSEVGRGTFSSLVSEKGYCRMLRFSWSGQFFVCFLKFAWCIWSKFPETEDLVPSLYTQKCHQEASLSLGSPENLCVSAARTVRWHLICRFTLTCLAPVFTTVFCANLVSFRRSQASGTWGWCHRLLCGLQVCVGAWAKQMPADGFTESEMP